MLCESCGKVYDDDIEGYNGYCQECCDDWADEHRCSQCNDVFVYDSSEDECTWWSLDKTWGCVEDSDSNNEGRFCSFACLRKYLQEI